MKGSALVSEWVGETFIIPFRRNTACSTMGLKSSALVLCVINRNGGSCSSLSSQVCIAGREIAWHHLAV